MFLHAISKTYIIELETIGNAVLKVKLWKV